MSSRFVASTLVCLLGLGSACEQSESAPHSKPTNAGERQRSTEGARQAAGRGGDEVDAGDVTQEGPTKRCDSFESPLERAGEEGNFVVRVLRIEPELLFKGRYDWSIELADQAKTPISGATLSVKPRMPAHGHGTTPVNVRAGPVSGRYELLDVNLFMAGLWQVPIEVTTADAHDRITIIPCVIDPPDSDAGADDAGTDDAGTE
jgi:hypothetical protein